MDERQLTAGRRRAAAEAVPWDGSLAFVDGDLDAVIRTAPSPSPADMALLAAWFPLAPLPEQAVPAAA